MTSTPSPDSAAAPTSCPYIVTGDEGTSHCSLAESRPVPPSPAPQADALAVFRYLAKQLVANYDELHGDSEFVAHTVSKFRLALSDYPPPSAPVERPQPDGEWVDGCPPGCSPGSASMGGGA